MKLRNRTSHMTSLPEGTPPSSTSAKLTKFIYFSVLILIAAYILYIFGSRFFYYTAPGFVEVEKTVISSSHGGRILQLAVTDEQKVKKDQLLAVIAAAKHCGEIDNNKVIKLKYDIDFNRSKLVSVQKDIKEIKATLSKFSLQRALETGNNTESARRKLELDLEKKRNAAELLAKQIGLQQRQLDELKGLNHRSVSSVQCFDEHLRSPFSGIVNTVNLKADEFAARGASLMILTDNAAAVRIEAYLKNKFLSHLHEGDILDVTFADGKHSKAKIEDIHAAAFNVSERDWKRPTEGQIRIHLIPLNEKDAALWKKYDRMEVSVRGKK